MEEEKKVASSSFSSIRSKVQDFPMYQNSSMQGNLESAKHEPGFHLLCFCGTTTTTFTLLLPIVLVRKHDDHHHPATAHCACAAPHNGCAAQPPTDKQAFSVSATYPTKNKPEISVNISEA
jgi:hypothetical protein